MHDIADLDARGVPGGMIATTAFEQAARAQAKSLGFEPAIVYVPHPIQDRTDAEIHAVADDAFEAIMAMLTSKPG